MTTAPFPSPSQLAPCSHMLYALVWARSLQRQAMVLLLLAFVVALMIPLYPVAKTGLAAHVIGITAALLLLGVASLVTQLRLSTRWLQATLWMLLLCLYLGFLTQWIGAFGGLSRMFIVTALGRPEGLPWLETLIEWIIKGLITPLTFIACGLLLWGLRGTPPSEASSA
jgi:(hydroxyamino)benzene mutase